MSRFGRLSAMKKHIPLLILTALNLFVSFYDTFLAHINVLQNQVSRGPYFAPLNSRLLKLRLQLRWSHLHFNYCIIMTKW